MFNSLWSYLTKSTNTVSLDEAYDILNEETPENNIQNESVPQENLLNTVYFKSGTITAYNANENLYTIDNKYTVELFDDSLQVGCKVTYDLLQYNDTITNVKFLDETWDESDIKQSIWSYRTIITKIESKTGKIITVDYEKMELNLDKIVIEFQPVVGDWVELDVKCEMDENVVNLCGRIIECTRIYPVRMHMVKGTITQWNGSDFSGIINKSIFFNGNALSNAYIPNCNDKIVAEVIESEQGQYPWRAIKIIPESFNKKVDIQAVEEEIETEHPDIKILCDNLKFSKLNERKQFKLILKNCSKDVYTVKLVEFTKVNSQCRLYPIPGHFHLLPMDKTDILCECIARNVGTTREFLKITFDDFSIGKFINIHVEIKPAINKNGVYRYKSNNNFIYDDPSRNFVRGQRVSSAPRFTYAKIEEFKVPDYLLRIVTANINNPNDLENALAKVKHCLFSNLSYHNYSDKFHTVLHLDEITSLIMMQNYNMEQACFITNGEYLSLEINNLAEKRPSVIVGDRLIASDFSNTDYEGIIHKITANHIHLKFSPLFHDSYQGEDYSVRIIANRATYKRQHNAIQLAMKNLGRDILFPTKIIERSPQTEFKQLEWYNESLNEYQKAAVINILYGLARPLPYIIFGPPGTGKTVTIIETILQIVRLIPQARLLICAPSNSATDLLALRLIDSCVLKPGDLVRIVSMNHMSKNLIPEKLVPFCTVSTVGSKPDYCSRMLLDESSKVVGRNRITVTTCGTAGILYTYGFPKGHFTHIIVDEAGQASEPEVLIPLAFLDSQSGQIILAGDPQQLGPVILSSVARDCGLQESYLERLVNRFPYARDAESFPNNNGYDPRLITKLLYNYRSLNVLLKLTSSLFYNDDLIPTIFESDLLNNLKEILPETGPNTPCTVFHSVNGENCQTEESPSWFNPDEAAQIFFYVNELYRLGVKSDEIGIITPYIKQVHEIRGLLTEAEFELPKIGTVEEFQGQEYSVILLSTVRSSESFLEMDSVYTLGFVSNPKRINVAISRAKTLLIIVGNPNLLCKDIYWRSVVKYCIENGGYTGTQLNYT